MDSGELAGKVAIVTGAASGIGRATARQLAGLGAAVAVLDIDGAGAERVAGELRAGGAAAIAVIADVGDTDAAERSVREVLDRLGRIDILVNNAGTVSDISLLEHDLATWERIQAVNLRGPFVLMRAVGRHMVERGGGGKIVNVSSSSAFRGERTNAAYAASKAGVTALTRTAAAELGPYDINVNAVAPGLTKTGMTEPYIGDDDAFLDTVASGPLANLLRRHSQPEDVAAVIVFLCRDASRQVTGQVLHTSAGAVL
jgi:NAD(P)-dependent dehydrogenase (short-subunit alcohol dehydrogenase family)